MIKTILVFFSILFIAGPASADLAAKSYVDSAVAKNVSTEATAEQTLQGHYTVTGIIEVETPKLPAALD